MFWLFQLRGKSRHIRDFLEKSHLTFEYRIQTSKFPSRYRKIVGPPSSSRKGGIDRPRASGDARRCAFDLSGSPDRDQQSP